MKRQWSVAMLARNVHTDGLVMKHFTLLSDDTESELQAQLLSAASVAWPSHTYVVLAINLYEIRNGGLTIRELLRGGA